MHSSLLELAKIFKNSVLSEPRISSEENNNNELVDPSSTTMVRVARVDTVDTSVDSADEDTVQVPTPDHVLLVIPRVETPIIPPPSPPITFRHLTRKPGQRRRQKNERIKKNEKLSIVLLLSLFRMLLLILP